MMSPRLAGLTVVTGPVWWGTQNVCALAAEMRSLTQFDAKQVRRTVTPRKSHIPMAGIAKHPEAGSQKLVRHLSAQRSRRLFHGPACKGIGGLDVPLEAQKGPQGRAAADPLDQAKQKKTATPTIINRITISIPPS